MVLLPVQQVSTDLKCFHCGEPIPRNELRTAEVGGEERNFCCHGCLTACIIIFEAGEESYYKNRTAPPPKLFSDAIRKIGSTPSAPLLTDAYDLPSLTEEFTDALPGNLRKLQLTIEGIHCSSCVFLNERILEKTNGIHDARVSYENGRATVIFDPDQIKISQIIKIVQSIGYNGVPYKPGSGTERMRLEGRNLLWKLFISCFLAVNVMMISVALWYGFFDQSLDYKSKLFFHWMEFLLAAPAFFYSGAIFHRGWKSFLKSGLLGMDMLVSIGLSVAFFYSVYVTVTNVGEVYFDSVTTIIFLLTLGRYIEWRARMSQRQRMEAHMRPLPVHCFRMTNSDGAELISVKDLRVNDNVLVEAGGIVPADGVLFGNRCEMDESVLTGESMPLLRESGDRLLAGSKVVSGSAKLRVSASPAESSLSVISKLADSAGSVQSKVERVAMNITPYFSAVVIGVSIISFIVNYFYINSGFESAMTSSIAVLIVSCPCALALSAPTAVGSAIYLGLKNGILVRDGLVLERLSAVKHFYFDKTGTITKGQPTIIDRLINQDEDESFIYRIVERMESGTSHPVGRALLERARERTLNLTNTDTFDQEEKLPEEIPGRGILWNYKGKEFRLGKLSFLMDESLLKDDPMVKEFSQKQSGATLVGLTENRTRLLAIFALKDVPEKNSKKVLTYLNNHNFHVSLLTGDRKSAADQLATEMGIPTGSVYSELLPEDKERVIKSHTEKGEHVCMVGDGYNDAIALSAASVSAVLARGASLSMEYAGIILLQNDLRGILTAQELARKTKRTIITNLVFSLCYNSIMIPLAAAGWMLPIWCAFFMASSSLTVIASSTLFRVGGIKNPVD